MKEVQDEQHGGDGEQGREAQPGQVGNQRGNNQFVHGCPVAYDRNRGCSQLVCDASSSDRVALRVRLSWTATATSATRLMAMTVCTTSMSQCQGVGSSPRSGARPVRRSRIFRG